METPVFDLAEKTVEDMAHFMEECDNIIMAHQSGLLWGRFGQIGNHGCYWIVACSVRLFEPRNHRPNSGV